MDGLYFLGSLPWSVVIPGILKYLLKLSLSFFLVISPFNGSDNSIIEYPDLSTSLNISKLVKGIVLPSNVSFFLMYILYPNYQ